MIESAGWKAGRLPHRPRPGQLRRAGTDSFAGKLATLDTRKDQLVALGRHSETLLNQARTVIHDIIAALTTDELQGTWSKLSELLKEVPAESESDQG